MSQKDRKQDFEEAHKQALAGWASWQMYSQHDLKVYLGNPWTSKDLAMFKMQGREPMSFPMIRRNIKLITGYQRKNRLSIKYDPVESQDDAGANDMTALGIYAMQRGRGNQILSDAFEGALITGMNLVNIYNDRNFNTQFDRFFYNQFLLDPNFSYRDLKDCHFGIMRKYITREQAKMILPGREDMIDAMDADKADNKFPQFKAPTLFREELLAYDEWQSRTTRKVTVLFNPLTGQENEWLGSREGLQILLVRFPDLIVQEKYKPTVEVTSYLGDEEVSHDIDLFGLDDFSFTPVMAYWHPEYDHMEEKLQSVVRGQIDSQRASDKRMMCMISLFEQQIGAGLDFETGALVDDDDAYATGNKPRQFTKGALREGRAKDRDIKEIPASMFQLQQLFQETMTKSVNINEELLGAPTGNPQIAGVLAQFRAGQALVGLQDLFDNMRLATSCIGRKMLRLLQQYPPSKVKRILGRDPSPAFAEKTFGEFDAVAVEGIETDTQRNMFYHELIQLKEMGNKIGDPAPIPWSMIFKFAPTQMKAELMDQMKQTEQQAQQKMQKEEQLQQLLQQLALAQAQSQLVSDQAEAVERRSAAVENQTDAAMNRVETAAKIAELQGKPTLELLKMAVELEKVNVAKEAAKNKPALPVKAGAK